MASAKTTLINRLNKQRTALRRAGGEYAWDPLMPADRVILNKLAEEVSDIIEQIEEGKFNKKGKFLVASAK